MKNMIQMTKNEFKKDPHMGKKKKPGPFSLIGFEMINNKQLPTMTAPVATVGFVYKISYHNNETGEVRASCISTTDSYSGNNWIGHELTTTEGYLAQEFTRPWNSGEYTLHTPKHIDYIDTLKSFITYIKQKNSE